MPEQATVRQMKSQPEISMDLWAELYPNTARRIEQWVRAHPEPTLEDNANFRQFMSQFSESPKPQP